MTNLKEALVGVDGYNRADERTLLVTISLEEYRDLIIENTMFEMENIDLKQQLKDLQEAYDELLGEDPYE